MKKICEIEKILTENHLNYKSIIKSEIGFINSVYLTESHVVKLYRNEAGFKKEKWFYTKIMPNYSPPLIAVGNNYLFFKKIEGTGLYRIWHELNDKKREEYVEKIASIILKLVNTKISEDETDKIFETIENWEKHIVNRIKNSASELLYSGHISKKAADDVFDYVRDNAVALRAINNDGKSIHSLCFNDLHFDNLLIDGNENIYLIDYETLCLAPCDFILDTWDRMSKYPYIYANENDHSNAVASDYTNIVFWMKKYAPQLFDFPLVEKRIALYGIMYDLDILCDYPNYDALINRLYENMMI